jgi:hypothetical protein
MPKLKEEYEKFISQETINYERLQKDFLNFRADNSQIGNNTNN